MRKKNFVEKIARYILPPLSLIYQFPTAPLGPLKNVEDVQICKLACNLETETGLKPRRSANQTTGLENSLRRCQMAAATLFDQYCKQQHRSYNISRRTKSIELTTRRWLAPPGSRDGLWLDEIRIARQLQSEIGTLLKVMQSTRPAREMAHLHTAMRENAAWKAKRGADWLPRSRDPAMPCHWLQITWPKMALIQFFKKWTLLKKLQSTRPAREMAHLHTAMR